MRFLLAAAGTAGHVEPALAVAEVLTARGHEVWILGTADGAERDLVPARGLPLLVIDKVAFPRTMGTAALRFPRAIVRAVRASQRHLKNQRIDAVLGFGGYAAGAAYAAATLSRVPFVVFSYDAMPGIANRWAGRWTRWRAVASPTTRAPFADAEVTGVPLRPGIRDFDRTQMAARGYEHFGLEPGRPTLLVFGGSLGAMRINESVLDCAPAIRAAGWQVLHITGSRDVAAQTRSRALQQPGQWSHRAYVPDMEDAYAVADLVVSRAGAMTCAELGATGVPGVLVPYAVGNGEQALNAGPLVESGGWIILRDADADATGLGNCLREAMRGDTLSAMTAHARAWSARLRGDDAAQRLATLLERAGA
ncbi:MAG: UDP-N-acetylglucosamine--N-acetylmuramyl-(pentapeptide) pyrophosphoryl-undecaprenol N-acetylglucosamine transferase [Actinobacteria bacterium]|nr:UDP-N-acetylglucosamine--N-acetylmuramyl-(pentapeptide) pyrophosphoryl-undecaprenol N-acetylglucosamine transferase [Actinomycetota bacterium]